MCRNNRNPKTSYIWCSIVRVKGIAVGLLPEKANMAKITRDLEIALDEFYASIPNSYKILSPN